jgi:4-hydroxybenzoate polyprenyltransferase
MLIKKRPPSKALTRLKLFLALSRTPHALLDLATPAVAALLWLGTFPSPGVTILGLITVFAGYTAVYALNDVVDYRADEEKMAQGGGDDGNYLDAVLVRHPLAQGLLTFPEAVWWMLAWAVVALSGASLLNPVCAYIFLGGCVLEAIYCKLLRYSHLRTLVSGVVKTLGGVAAVLAVDPKPSPVFLTVLFLWLFCWEIGGQNVPADWHDLEEDRRRQARTIPVVLGPKKASKTVLATLAASVVLSLAVLELAPIRLTFSYQVIVLAAGIILLLLPALRLHQTQKRDYASRIFNLASYYPAAILAVILISSWF